MAQDNLYEQSVTDTAGRVLHIDAEGVVCTLTNVNGTTVKALRDIDPIVDNGSGTVTVHFSDGTDFSFSSSDGYTDSMAIAAVEGNENTFSQTNRFDGDLFSANGLKHRGDSNTAVNFDTDRVTINAGGVSAIDVTEANGVATITLDPNATLVNFPTSGGESDISVSATAGVTDNTTNVTYDAGNKVDKPGGTTATAFGGHAVFVDDNGDTLNHANNRVHIAQATGHVIINESLDVTGDLEANVGTDGTTRSFNAGTDVHFTTGATSYLQGDTSAKKVYYDKDNASGGVSTSDDNEIMNAGGLEIGATSVGHTDHLDNAEEATIDLGYDGRVISELALNVETSDADAAETFIKRNVSGQIVFSLADLIQASDLRPATSAAVHAALANVSGGGENNWPTTYTESFTLTQGAVWVYNGKSRVYHGTTLTIDSSGDLSTLQPNDSNLLWSDVNLGLTVNGDGDVVFDQTDIRLEHNSEIHFLDENGVSDAHIDYDSTNHTIDITQAPNGHVAINVSGTGKASIGDPSVAGNEIATMSDLSGLGGFNPTEYDPTQVYQIGDLVTADGELFQCTATTTAQPGNATIETQGAFFRSITETLASVDSFATFALLTPTNAIIRVGEIMCVINDPDHYKNGLYRVLTHTSGGTTVQRVDELEHLHNIVDGIIQSGAGSNTIEFPDDNPAFITGTLVDETLFTTVEGTKSTSLPNVDTVAPKFQPSTGRMTLVYSNLSDTQITQLEAAVGNDLAFRTTAGGIVSVGNVENADGTVAAQRTYHFYLKGVRFRLGTGRRQLDLVLRDPSEATNFVTAFGFTQNTGLTGNADNLYIATDGAPVTNLIDNISLVNVIAVGGGTYTDALAIAAVEGNENTFTETNRFDGILFSAGGLTHRGDSNTAVVFDTDKLTLQAGGINAIDVTTTTANDASTTTITFPADATFVNGPGSTVQVNNTGFDSVNFRTDVTGDNTNVRGVTFTADSSGVVTGSVNTQGLGTGGGGFSPGGTNTDGLVLTATGGTGYAWEASPGATSAQATAITDNTASRHAAVTINQSGSGNAVESVTLDSTNPQQVNVVKTNITGGSGSTPNQTITTTAPITGATAGTTGDVTLGIDLTNISNLPDAPAATANNETYNVRTTSAGVTTLDNVTPILSADYNAIAVKEEGKVYDILDDFNEVSGGSGVDPTPSITESGTDVFVNNNLNIGSSTTAVAVNERLDAVRWIGQDAASVNTNWGVISTTVIDTDTSAERATMVFDVANGGTAGTNSASAAMLLEGGTDSATNNLLVRGTVNSIDLVALNTAVGLNTNKDTYPGDSAVIDAVEAADNTFTGENVFNQRLNLGPDSTFANISGMVFGGLHGTTNSGIVGTTGLTEVQGTIQSYNSASEGGLQFGAYAPGGTTNSGQVRLSHDTLTVVDVESIFNDNITITAPEPTLTLTSTSNSSSLHSPTIVMDDQASGSGVHYSDIQWQSGAAGSKIHTGLISNSYVPSSGTKSFALAVAADNGASVQNSITINSGTSAASNSIVIGNEVAQHSTDIRTPDVSLSGITGGTGQYVTIAADGSLGAGTPSGSFVASNYVDISSNQDTITGAKDFQGSIRMGSTLTRATGVGGTPDNTTGMRYDQNRVRLFANNQVFIDANDSTTAITNAQLSDITGGAGQYVTIDASGNLGAGTPAGGSGNVDFSTLTERTLPMVNVEGTAFIDSPIAERLVLQQGNGTYTIGPTTIWDNGALTDEDFSGGGPSQTVYVPIGTVPEYLIGKDTSSGEIDYASATITSSDGAVFTYDFDDINNFGFAGVSGSGLGRALTNIFTSDALKTAFDDWLNDHAKNSEGKTITISVTVQNSTDVDVIDTQIAGPVNITGPVTVVSTVAGTADDPDFNMFRDVPGVAGQELGAFRFQGRDSSDDITNYVIQWCEISEPTDGDSHGSWYVDVADTGTAGTRRADAQLRIVSDTTRGVTIGLRGRQNSTGLPTGTLASPPVGMVIGDDWLDTTDSTDHPIRRTTQVNT